MLKDAAGALEAEAILAKKQFSMEIQMSRAVAVVVAEAAKGATTADTEAKEG